MTMENPRLIVSIVRKGWGDTVLESSMNAGAHGGTVLFGRGIGRNEQQRVFGIKIEPEKEVVLTVVPAGIVQQVLDAITAAAELSAPGHGLAFVVPVEQVAGVVHLVTENRE
jgi:nitrogen regulatory protein P-II 1|nr:MAG: transcriptional regulator [Pseudomonadota bacterium]